MWPWWLAIAIVASWYGIKAALKAALRPARPILHRGEAALVALFASFFALLLS